MLCRLKRINPEFANNIFHNWWDATSCFSLRADSEEARFTLMGRLTGNWRFTSTQDVPHVILIARITIYTSRAPFTFAHKTENEERWNWHCRTSYLWRATGSPIIITFPRVHHTYVALKFVIDKYTMAAVSHRFFFEIHFLLYVLLYVRKMRGNWLSIETKFIKK